MGYCKIMKLELHSASNFLVHLVRLSSRSSINDAHLEKFRLSLVEVLRRRYRDHWFPNKTANSSTTSNNENKNNQQNNVNNSTNQALDNNCKETLRKMDYLLDPRKSVSIEQLAA